MTKHWDKDDIKLGWSERQTIDPVEQANKRKRTLTLVTSTWRVPSSAFRVTTIKALLFSVNSILCALCFVQAGFWTFYFPNFLKPNGYKELTGMIESVEADMNSTMDNFSDIQYFWSLMKQFDNLNNVDTMYPEESACGEVFPLFRDMAIEYAHIDYELYMKPLQLYHQYLLESRAEWYPDGKKSKTILPREWEQKIFEAELETKIIWYEKLAKDEDYKKRREKLVIVWNSIKRSLDSSLACLYLRYSYRQIAEDINQIALDLNLERMGKALELLKSAYKRIEKFKDSDKKAVQKIEEDMEKEKRSEIKS